MLENCFRNRKILVTGHTGFKGCWLVKILSELGAKLYGYSAHGEERYPLYYYLKNRIVKESIGRVEDTRSLKEFLTEVRPDFIFHLAAQPLVLDSIEDPLNTFMSNTIGTINVLLTSLGNLEDARLVIITSDKVYENRNWDWGYREIDKLGGVDPYSASKACAEIALSAVFRTFSEKLTSRGIRVAIARAGNVFGGGDFSANRLVPDAYRAWLSRKTLEIRQPKSVRPWQHVLVPLSGYLELGRDLDYSVANNFEAFNFGPKIEDCLTVRSLMERLTKEWGEINVAFHTEENSIESKLLTLNSEKAANRLRWGPPLNLTEGIEFTVSFYREWAKDPVKCLGIMDKQVNCVLERIT